VVSVEHNWNSIELGHLPHVESAGNAARDRCSVVLVVSSLASNELTATL
jgi:hypothetical protein